MTEDREDGDALENAYIRSTGVTEWRWSVYRRLKTWWANRRGGER